MAKSSTKRLVRLAFGHESHRDFNDHLASRKVPQPATSRIDGPWLSTEALRQLPQVGRAFDMNRDVYIRRQLLDKDKTEAQRRGEQEGRGSGMVGRDKPVPKVRPGEKISRPVDRAAFNSKWMAEHRDAVMARAVVRQGKSTDTIAPMRKPRGPSR